MHRHVMFGIALLAFGCCTSEPISGTPTLYERVGGMEAIAAVVDEAVRNIAADTRINRRFAGAKHAQLTNNLVDLFCVRTGGPCSYRGVDMSTAHEGMQIRDDEFDALVEDLMKAFDTFKVPEPEKRELLAILTQMRGAIVGH